MRKSELQYDLPPELIAQQPAEQRDSSRLLVLDRPADVLRHEVFASLPSLLPAGSLLVMNDTRVLPARLYLARRSGGRVEGLFLNEAEAGTWEMMLTGSGRLKVGEELQIDGSTRRLRLINRAEASTWFAEPVPGGPVADILAECGHTPLPPYIRRGKHGNDTAGTDKQEHDDRERYQTVYARQPGAVAAPTAGLHFTPEVLTALRTADIEIVFVTLHVGVGTFAPIRCDDLADHQMHAEWYDCPAATAEMVNAARAQGRPIVAVGTTSVRVLETCAEEHDRVVAGRGWTRIFIYPPYRFRVVDHMVTNFHLPGSTLLAMLFAFAGRETVLNAYNEAIRERYRFYSYGDAMLVL